MIQQSCLSPEYTLMFHAWLPTICQQGSAPPVAQLFLKQNQVTTALNLSQNCTIQFVFSLHQATDIPTLTKTVFI